ncbi:sulfatase [Planctomycetes bacterium K23_9]|uniref:Arylsulfatase n=1 Tax=Stieleria marina TaxID=1930275 RepID=A0A517NVF5_9BACT|nr:Arylsulfatase [Planctomycetes bacterium K23_9]
MSAWNCFRSRSATKVWPALVACFGACISVGVCPTAGAAAEGKPPNVLLIVADDLNCAISPYGDPVAVTPNLQQLAEQGVTFRRAYCQQAVCNPSRSSFLTGLRPDTVGVDDLRKGFRSTAPNGENLITLPQHFKNAGYFCQNIGKIFHNMGDTTHDPISWSVPEILHKGTHATDTHFALSAVPGQKRPYKAPVTEQLPIRDNLYRDGQIAEAAVQMINDYDANAPFFLAVGFWRPHLPFVAPKKYWDLYDPDQISLPYPSAVPANAPAIALHSSREIKGYGLVPKDRPFTQSEIRHYRHGYYASISFLDSQLGKILTALRSSGHDQNTIIVFLSDHGFHVGQKSLWGKTSNFELDARVPLIMVDPTKEQTAGQSSDSLAELIDIYPTLAELTNTQSSLAANLEGESLASVLIDPGKSVKSAAYTQHQQPFYGKPENWKAWGRSVRTARWRFTQWTSIDNGKMIARELYDHQTDPHEEANLASLSEHADTVNRLQRLLTSQASGD